MSCQTKTRLQPLCAFWCCLRHMWSQRAAVTQMLASLSICARRPTAVDQRKSFAAPTSMIQLPTEGSPQNTEMATVDAAPHWQASPPAPIMMVRGPRRRGGGRDDSGASGRTSIPPSLAGRHPRAAARGLEGGCKPGPRVRSRCSQQHRGRYEAKPPRLFAGRRAPATPTPKLLYKPIYKRPPP